MFKSKKGQTSVGLITGLVFGIALLILAVIIAFVIVFTLSDSDLLAENRATAAVVNESGDRTVYINATGYQLDGLGTYYVPGTIVITQAWNETADGTVVPSLIASGNYSVSSTGIVLNATAIEYSNVSLSYTSSVYTIEERSKDHLTGNFTKAVDNVSTKIPTILLVASIVLILGVLVLLVGAWQRMRIGGGSI